MNQDLWSIIDELEATVTDGMHLPLSDRVMISEQEVFSLLDELRAMLPEEISQARNVVMEEERILREARERADRTVKEAEEYAARLVSESAVNVQAEEEAKKKVAEAEETARKIKVEAHRYVDDVLKQLSGVLGRAMERVSEGRKELRASGDIREGRTSKTGKRTSKTVPAPPGRSE
ncbi:MAG: hypothetical protein ACLFS8_01365 [Clostridia bacterium]